MKSQGIQGPNGVQGPNGIVVPAAVPQGEGKMYVPSENLMPAISRLIAEQFESLSLVGWVADWNRFHDRLHMLTQFCHISGSSYCGRVLHNIQNVAYNCMTDEEYRKFTNATLRAVAKSFDFSCWCQETASKTRSKQDQMVDDTTLRQREIASRASLTEAERQELADIDEFLAHLR